MTPAVRGAEPRWNTARGAAAAAIVAAAIGIVLPYATMRLGFGPNVSIISTLLGYTVLRAARACGRDSLHAAHVAGVAAGQTAFMGVALVAFEILRARHGEALGPRPSGPALFLWLASAGVLGVLAALPLRRHYIEDEKLTFAAGAAAAETILALEAGDDRRRTRALGASFLGSVVFTLVRPARMAIGPLGVGTGMLIGLRVALSMVAGYAVSRIIPAPLLAWVASPLMVTGGITAAALRVPALAGAFRASPEGAPIPPGIAQRRWIPLTGAFGAMLCLCVVDRYALGLPFSLTFASVALAAPLLLVGTRVLGETNWAPVLSLATVAQAALGALSPGCLTVTMVGSAVCGAIPNGGQHMMQSFRAASIVGARTRDTVLAQILGVVVGAIALAWSYPMLAAHAAGGDVTSPLSEVWATFAEAFAGGAGAIPEGARGAAVVAGIAGVVLALVERRFPALGASATAMGIGMLVPGGLVGGVMIGSALGRATSACDPAATAERGTAVASGLVAGEAIAAALAAIGGRGV